MKHPILLLLVAILCGTRAEAHVGSPDLFYSGNIGPYPARVTIRVPRVIPGRAEISVRLETSEPAQVSFLPLYAKTSIKNAPPPDLGQPVPGEPNLYAGELWLMSFGSYSVEVRAEGRAGSGSVQIPLTSVATRQLPMPPALGGILAVLGSVLVIGLIAIVHAAAREAVVPAGQLPGTRERRKAWIAATVTSFLLAGTLYGGWRWWKAEERDFREHLREGAWPDLAAQVNATGGTRILQLRLGNEGSDPGKRSQFIPPLIPDHGKLMHLFLIREGTRDTFAHLHPVRKDRASFEVNLPALPSGRYTIFSDLTFEGGTSSTATASVDVPEPTSDTSTVAPLPADPDDSWSHYAPEAVPKAADQNAVFRLRDGTTVTWKKSQNPLRAGKDASLKFEIADSGGNPIHLEPYMGMLSHAAVLRSDGAVFAHLHPSGNYSMAAQSFFADKLAQERNQPPAKLHGTGHGHMMGSSPHSMHAAHPPASAAVSVLDIPYEFPEGGDYRIWVQFKHAGAVHTAVFDASVVP